MQYKTFELRTAGSIYKHDKENERTKKVFQFTDPKNVIYHKTKKQKCCNLSSDDIFHDLD